jgi:MFS family permease
LATAPAMPGLGLALSSVGFGAITTFIMLLFAQRGWDQAWLALTAVSIAFILGRLFFGHQPDRISGVKVALVWVVIEAAGQTLIWWRLGPRWCWPGCAHGVRLLARPTRVLAWCPGPAHSECHLVSGKLPVQTFSGHPLRQTTVV